MFELIILILVGIDQISKHFAKQYLESKGSIAIVDSFFHLTYVENRGAAFGMLQNARLFFIIISVIAIIVGITYLHNKKSTRGMKFVISMILAGAVGNLIDRFRFGYVIDFLDFNFIWSYVFNIADIFVVIGTIFLCILILVEDKNKKVGDSNE